MKTTSTARRWLAPGLLLLLLACLLLAMLRQEYANPPTMHSARLPAGVPVVRKHHQAPEPAKHVQRLRPAV